MFLAECLVSLQIGKPLMIKVTEVLRIEDCHVGIALLEHIFDEIFFGVSFEFLFGPDILVWAEMMIIVKTVDKLFPVNILLVSWTPVPQMGVSVNNEDIFAGFGSKHSWGLLLVGC
jgi:hypothetical protein